VAKKRPDRAGRRENVSRSVRAISVQPARDESGACPE
jgi:hypothetical protein